MGQVIESLGLNMTILAQMFNFIILVIFIRLVVYPHILRILEQRQETIANNVARAEEERKEAEALRQQYLAEMKKARDDADEIIQKATKTASDEARAIIDASKEEAERIKNAALQDIEREKEKAVLELRDQVATLSVLIAGKIIDEKITSDIQRDLVDEFIKEAGDLPC